jgi:hypothetical protein
MTDIRVTSVIQTSTGTKILLYADDTSIIVTSPNLENFETKIDNIFVDNNWFETNQLMLNYNKTNWRSKAGIGPKGYYRGR